MNKELPSKHPVTLLTEFTIEKLENQLKLIQMLTERVLEHSEAIKDLNERLDQTKNNRIGDYV